MIDEILELAGDEFVSREELLDLAKASSYELIAIFNRINDFKVK